MPTPIEIIEGRIRLQELLPQALKEAQGDKMKAIAKSGVAKSMAAHLTLANLDSLTIHEGEEGGWVVDLILKDMPPGVPSALGTPVGDPHKTREEAVEHAPQLLAYMVMLAQMPKEEAVDPVFEFHNLEFKLSPELLRTLVEQGIQQEVDLDYSYNRLAEVTQKYFPEGCSAEKMDAIERKGQLEILTVIHMAGALGLFRYPEPVAKPPVSH